MKLIVNVTDAKNLLTENREKHLNEYQLQLEAWKVEYEKFTEVLKEWSQKTGEDGDYSKRPAEPLKPNYHVHSYDKLINKLNVHVGETIEIDENGYGNSEYEKIFENKFDWSNSFQGLTASYISNGSLSADKIDGASINNALIGSIGE